MTIDEAIKEAEAVSKQDDKRGKKHKELLEWLIIARETINLREMLQQQENRGEFCDSCFKKLTEFSHKNDGFIFITPDGRMMDGNPANRRLRIITCPACNGSGEVFQKKCIRCKSNGTIFSLVVVE